MAENKMKEIKIEKITLNFGVGETGDPLKRAAEVVKTIIEVTPVQTRGKSKIPTWGVREGLPIGLKATLRGEKAYLFLERAFQAVDKQLKKKSFDMFGNFGFGIKEYIDLPGVKYDPKLGIMGFDVLVTLERPGYRVKKRKYLKQKIGKNQIISKTEAIDFIAQRFGVEVLG